MRRPVSSGLTKLSTRQVLNVRKYYRGVLNRMTMPGLYNPWIESSTKSYLNDLDNELRRRLNYLPDRDVLLHFDREQLGVSRETVFEDLKPYRVITAEQLDAELSALADL